MENSIRLTVLGARGSVPVSGEDFRLFGGASSCYLVEAGEQAVFLDAGTGILRAPVERLADKRLSVLLTHTHIDHILGLPFFAPLSEPGREIALLGAARGGRTTAQQLRSFFAEPLWPCPLEDYPARVRVRDIEGAFALGELRVESLALPHPGGCSAYRLSRGGKSLVCATDFEHLDGAAEALAAFARDADLLLYDAQYPQADYPAHRGFGHSTAEMGLEVLRRSGAKRLLLVHHGPEQTDAMLLERERQLGCAAARFAREGEVIEL